MAGENTDMDGQAAYWIERMSRPAQDGATAAAFDQWIAQDPRHVERYAQMASLWQSDGLASALGARMPRNDNETETDTPDLPAPGEERHLRRVVGRWLQPRRLAGMAACVLAPLALVPVARGVAAPNVPYIAPHGESRDVMLADGSSVRMSGGTALSVRITPWSRSVRMTRGEAFFDVAHERLRGFSVDTGSARVAVLGTAFDVNLLQGGNREVRVYRGQVSVAAGNGAWRLPAGTGLALSGTRVRSLDDVEGSRPGWIDGWFDAQDTPLALLIERLNRISDKPVQLADPGLGELQVSGRFQIDHPQEVLEMLAVIHGLRLRDDGRQYVLSRQ